MPCMPETKTMSPALTPRLQVPSALMAPGGLRVLTPFGVDEDGDCATPGVDARIIAVTQRRARRCNIGCSNLQDVIPAENPLPLDQHVPIPSPRASASR